MNIDMIISTHESCCRSFDGDNKLLFDSNCPSFFFVGPWIPFFPISRRPLPAFFVIVIVARSRMQPKLGIDYSGNMDASCSTTDPETICLQCGDIGFANAFVYCVKCLEFAVHRYCLDVIPKTADEFVPWVCDDCDMEMKNQLAVRKNDAIRCKTRDHTALKHIVGNSGVGSKKNDMVALKTEESIYEGGPHQYYELKWPDLEIQRSEGSGVNVSKDYNTSRESEVNEGRTPASHHMCKEILRDPTIPTIADCNMWAEPVMMPIWRGSFDIWNKIDNMLNGLVAHMSSKACRRVYNEASQFRPVLHLEMLPKSNVWPKSFERSEPTGESIALYFFPSELRSERAFDYLVDEMVHEELALRAMVQNAELLVFTSMELPLPCWRFQGKYYLWGVFKEMSKIKVQPRNA